MSSFDLAQQQFDEAADKLGLDPSMRELLRWPLREFTFTIPVKMDDGSSRVFRGYRVHHNDARGPCKGGIRWQPDETIDTVRALGAWMTWKTAALDLPLGGGKGGVACDPKQLSEREQERLARGWVRVMAHELGGARDSPAPDLYTDRTIMAWMLDEYEVMTGRSSPAAVTGKPLAVGGSLGRDDATARGGIYVVREACEETGVDPCGRYAIQGCGNAGRAAALLHKAILGGGTLVAISDSKGGVYSENGLNPEELIRHKEETGSVVGFPGSRSISNEELLELDVEVLYPSAIEGVITGENAGRVRARILCELANGPTTPDADGILCQNGVHVLPDFLANAGGVTVSYFEQVQGASNFYWPEKKIHRDLDGQITRAYHELLQRSREAGVHMRLAAYLVAIERVAKAVRLRGWV